MASKHFNKRRGEIRQGPLEHAKGYELAWMTVAPIFNAVRALQVDNASYVYFIGEEDGPLKIGLAKDPIRRLRSMRTGNPRPLRVEHVLVGTTKLEKDLHEMYRDFAVIAPGHNEHVGPAGTEWFRAEIREALFPVIDTVAKYQVRAMANWNRLDIKRLEAFVHKAHAERGFPQGRSLTPKYPATRRSTPNSTAS